MAEEHEFEMIDPSRMQTTYIFAENGECLRVQVLISRRKHFSAW